MTYFRIEFSDTAERLDVEALSEEERATLFQGIQPDPKRHDVYRILLAVVDAEARPTWTERQKKRKLLRLVDKVLMNFQPMNASIQIAGVFPPSILAGNQGALDLEAKGDVKILEIANASLRLKGPIKDWWRKERPLVVSNRTNRFAQWVFSREWLDQGRQCHGEIVCMVPKDLEEHRRIVSCHAAFKEKAGRAIEKTRKHVLLPI